MGTLLGVHTNCPLMLVPLLKVSEIRSSKRHSWTPKGVECLPTCFPNDQGVLRAICVFFFFPGATSYQIYIYICAMVKSRYIGDGHTTFNRNPYNGYINPYYWVDDHPLLYGNNGSLDPGTYNIYHEPWRNCIKIPPPFTKRRVTSRS